jgi:hypothetical protein
MKCEIHEMKGNRYYEYIRNFKFFKDFQKSNKDEASLDDELKK